MNTKRGNPSMETSVPPEKKNKNLLKDLSALGNEWRLQSAQCPRSPSFSAAMLCF